MPLPPLPAPDALSAGFWQAANAGRLVVQECTECGWLAYPPDAVCPGCLTPKRSFRWRQVSGRGVLRSWTVVHTAFLPWFGPLVPYVVAAAELEEQGGLRLTARLADPPGTPLAYGAPVDTVFEELADGVAVPLIRLTPAAER